MQIMCSVIAKNKGINGLVEVDVFDADEELLLLNWGLEDSRGHYILVTNLTVSIMHIRYSIKKLFVIS